MLPIIQPIGVPTIPIPEVIEQVWFVQMERAEWTVVEQCWTVPDPLLGWFEIESGIREVLNPLQGRSTVGVDIDWSSDGWCLRIQGNDENVYTMMGTIRNVLEEWSPVSNDDSMVNLNQHHYNWLEGQSKRNLFKLTMKSAWYEFWNTADWTTVVYSNDFKTDIDWSWKPESRWHFPARKLTVEIPSGECLISDSDFPQIAATVDIYIDDLTTTEMKYLNHIMGVGVRSRLSNQVREELGLVYSIGSQYMGGKIRVSWTTDAVQFSDSLRAVESVVYSILEKPITNIELQTVRSQLIRTQIEILEEPTLTVRMLNLFDYPDGWSTYVTRIMKVPGVENYQSLDSLRMEYRFTGSPKDILSVVEECQIH